LNPGDQGWGINPANTTDNTLQRKASVTFGDANGSDTFEPSLEWNGFTVDTVSDLGIPLNYVPVVGFASSNSNDSESVIAIDIPVVLSAG
jgi:hypothetical protein